MKDAVIGCITKYEYSQIEPWVVSLERTVTNCDKVMIVYDIGQPTIDKLLSKGFIIVKGSGQSPNICVNRFHDIAKFLRENSYRWVVSTDVKDVIFQHDPFDEFSLRTDYFISTESIHYEHEPWGKQNLQLSFGPEVYERMKHWEIVNAGVLGGSAQYVGDLAENIYQLCAGRPQYVPGGGGPDQAALNFLLTLMPFSTYYEFSPTWCCQAGTTADPSKIEAFRPHLLIREPNMTVRGIVTTDLGEDFSIVHQYDRNPLWKEIIDRKYRE